MKKYLLVHERAARGAAGIGAFTLTELVIVLAIIGLLVSILFPVFGRIRERARQANCASNLHQIGLGFLQYTQDNDGMMPPGDGYIYTNLSQQSGYLLGLTSYIQPYIKSTQVLHCPEDPVQDGVGVNTTANGDYTDYAYNYYLGNVGPASANGKVCNAAGTDCESVANSETVVVVPGATVLATDGSPYSATQVALGPVFGESYDSHGWYSIDYNNPNHPHVYSVPALRHAGGANYLLCDGHVKWILPQNVGTGWASRALQGEYTTANSGAVTYVPSVSSQNLGNYQATFSPD